MLGLSKQVAYLVIGCLWEVLIPETHSPEGFGPDQTHDLFSFLTGFFTASSEQRFLDTLPSTRKIRFPTPSISAKLFCEFAVENQPADKLQVAIIECRLIHLGRLIGLM